MDAEILKKVGKSLYQLNIPKELKRYLVFMGRCYVHKKDMEGLLNFFSASPLRRDLLKGNPSFVEQVTRAFFYKDSTFDGRIKIVENHIKLLEEATTEDFLQSIYCKREKLTIWQEDFEGAPLALKVWFHGGQRKEGCLALSLNLGDREMYQIMFWLSPGLEGEKSSLWIGAIQGTPQGSDVIKALTKRFFGYRTKNLIFYGLRNLAGELKCQNIYAVTNDGYYAMNHIRRDRKLKTSFGDFWEECGGTSCTDKRFFKIPLEEYRKDMSELKPSKRAQHRRRFEVMDAITEAIHNNMSGMVR